MKKIAKFLMVVCAATLCCGIASACGGEETPSLATITGVTFQGASYVYDGTERELAVEGTLPNGVSVRYENHTATNAGEYAAKAILTGEGYQTLQLNATLIISKATYDMSGVTWDYAQAFTYDGTEKSVVLSGLPEGVTIDTYTDAAKTNAGEYIATANFTYDTVNYNTPTVPACEWVINKATLTGITFEGDTFVYNGEEKKISITGDVPAGVNVEYANNAKTEAGTYEATVVLSGSNYHTLELSATWRILPNLQGLAEAVIESFGSVPDPWEFLPETFGVENRAIATEDIPDYSNFVAVNKIPLNGMGKQLNMVYGEMTKMDTALSYVQPVYAIMNTIKGLYTTFLDSHPEDYTTYSNTVGGITFTMSLGETQYLLNATVKGVDVSIYSDLAEKTYGARVQIANNNLITYEVGEDSLQIATIVLDVSALYLEFVRTDDGVLGYIYEYLGMEGKFETVTSALLEVNENYTIVMGTKGDFIPTSVSRNCEVYRNSDGQLVGTEVREELTIAGFTDTYNTLWYPLENVKGITSIKKVDEANVMNADTIYINNYEEESIHTKLYSGINKKTGSRRFDIEFKTMYFFTYNATEEKYEQVKVEVPMMFIQEEKLDDFEDNFASANSKALNSGSVILQVEANTKTQVAYGYYTLLTAYDLISENVTFNDIKAICGLTTTTE